MSIKLSATATITKDGVGAFVNIGGEAYAVDYSINNGINGTVVPGNTYNQLLSIAVANYAKIKTLLLAANAALTISFNGTNAVQSITLGGSPTSGTFTITYSAITSAGIAYNATAATVQAALQAMSSIGANNCTVTGSAGGPWTVTFVGQLGVEPITTITGSASGLSGGTPTITLASVTTGVVPTASMPAALNAGQATFWASVDGIFTNPITANFTQINLTNAAGSAAVFYFDAGMSN